MCGFCISFQAFTEAVHISQSVLVGLILLYFTDIFFIILVALSIYVFESLGRIAHFIIFLLLYLCFHFMQQSNDVCLAYTLAAICNLLSETGISSTTGILGSSYSPLTSIGVSFSIQQQLFVLLRGSLKRAENLKLKRLVASNHLAMARFELTV